MIGTANEAGPSYVRGGWKNMEFVASPNELSVEVGGTFSVAVENALEVGSLGIATQGAGSRLQVDTISFSGLA